MSRHFSILRTTVCVVALGLLFSLPCSAQSNIVNLNFCGLFTDGTGGVLLGSYIKYDQAKIDTSMPDYDLDQAIIDARIITRRNNQDLTYNINNLNSIVEETTSVSSNISGSTQTVNFPEAVRGWRFLLPGAGDFFAVFPNTPLPGFLATVQPGQVLTNELLTEFRITGPPGKDRDRIANVPEPSSIAFFSFGTLGMALFASRRRVK